MYENCITFIYNLPMIISPHKVSFTGSVGSPKPLVHGMHISINVCPRITFELIFIIIFIHILKYIRKS